MQPETDALDYRDAQILELAFRDSCRCPGGFTHLQNLLYWDRYPKLVEMGLLELGTRYMGIGIYRLTPLALALIEHALSTPEHGDA